MIVYPSPVHSLSSTTHPLNLHNTHTFNILTKFDIQNSTHMKLLQAPIIISSFQDVKKQKKNGPKFSFQFYLSHSFFRPKKNPTFSASLDRKKKNRKKEENNPVLSRPDPTISLSREQQETKKKKKNTQPLWFSNAKKKKQQQIPNPAQDPLPPSPPFRALISFPSLPEKVLRPKKKKPKKKRYRKFRKVRMIDRGQRSVKTKPTPSSFPTSVSFPLPFFHPLPAISHKHTFNHPRAIPSHLSIHPPPVLRDQKKRR